MLTAFQSALSALSAQSTAISVIGNNLANLNTTGFKGSSTEFADLVSQSFSDGQTQVGMGVGTPVTRRTFFGGTVQMTSGPLDVAIKNDGFLVVKDSNGATLYTRAGNLAKDAQGNLTDATGNYYIQGWTATNGVVNTTGPIGNINIPIGSLKPGTATQNMYLASNLDATSTPVPTASMNASNVTYSTGMTVYDSLGASHIVTVNFWNNGGNAWSWQATIPGADVGQTAPAQIGNGTLNFNSSGELTTAATPVSQLSATGLVNGASNLTIDFNLYRDGAPLFTQYQNASGPRPDSSQDGAASAELSSVSIGQGGAVIGSYSDGTKTTLGQLAMANFVNPETLIAVGDNNFQTSAATSPVAIGMPNTGGRGDLIGGSLESSNVDIATEFTKLMTGQRAYQANSKVITTADQMNQDTINLIR